MNPMIRTLLAAVVLSLLPAGAGFGQEPKPEKEEAHLVVQNGHTSSVGSVAFSPDGKRVLTGDHDATRLWDIATGKELLALEVGAPSMVFSADGKYILTGNDDDQTARLWDAHTGQELHSLTGHRHGVTSVAFSPDGKQLLTGAMDHAVLWDAQSGKQLKTFKGQVGGKVWSAAISPDMKQIVTGDGPRTARLLDAQSGREQHILRGHTSLVVSVAFSPDGKHVVTGSMDRTARLWEADTGKFLRAFIGHAEPVYSVAFAPDGKHVLTGSYDHTARLWEADSGKEVHVLKGHADRVVSVAYSPDSKQLLTGCWDGTARLWDARTGKELRLFSGRGYSRKPVALSRDGTRLLVASTDATARLWDVRGGTELFALKGHKAPVTAVAFAPDGKRLLTGSHDHTARLWDADSGKEVIALNCTKDVIAVAFSEDGKVLLTASTDHKARQWDAESGKELRAVQYPDTVISVAFSADGKQVLTGGTDDMARLWDAESGKERALKCGSRVTSVAISRDGKRLLTGTADRKARLWDAESGKELRSGYGGSAVAFSADGKRILTAADDHNTRVWDAQASDKPQLMIRGHLKTVAGVMFSEDGKTIVTADDLTRLWDAGTGKELCRLVSFGGKGGWAVVDGAGRYDASNGGDVEGLHWVVNLEPVALNQLKDRYYEPGLLAKHLGFNKEPLRNVKAFRDVKLYPTVAVAQSDPKKPQFKVGLTNSGGGIGRVVVLVNGKEQTADARPKSANANADKLDVEVDLSNDPRVVPGQKNKVEVLAYNSEGYLSSRGLTREFDGPGPAAAEPAYLHAVVVGVSKYGSERLSLRYAAKDAENFADALELAAEGLFPKRAHVIKLTAAEGDQRPTRANILKALEALKTTKPGDIVVVYLAGHGVTVPQAGKDGSDGDWYYLTAEAQNFDLADAAVRRQVSLSSDELTDLLRATPAQKQVLILDTCHSGRVVEKLSERRDVPSNQVRAVERVKDRTGMHVLAGCAADSVSYEATRYGQGLLTYSLLMGMHGAKLKNGELVDVVELFGYAVDKVPELARDIGGVQRPTIASPRGDPFNIGRLTAADQAKMPPLQTVKPVVLRSVFQLEKPAVDSLKLSKLINDRLREASSAPRGAKLVYVDAEDFPGALLVTGRYKVEDGKVTVTITLFTGVKAAGEPFTVEGTEDKKDELAGKIAAEIEKRLPAGGGK